ncbi:DUF4167 domain-containing protein [Neorhizobium lilium]|uniref:DUF4167 domain-containing protein n=1 Tax=Neorhizobium lilium TaxID=2503024 RepID=A0A3S3RP65_9HYPH|nr:DUF4167 domain-containing protein [Neorhizobium lilium]RWX74356.1 DUF4167 domain-containing protein [Neorhizobium lilium]
MRPGQQNKRGRGRGTNNNNNGGSGGGNNNFNRKGGNPLSRTYDSSGPDVKIRGTAQHIAEKYSTLARDAQSSGDRVMAENYLQHAEHYNRIIAAAQAQMQDRFPRDERGEMQDRDGNVLDQDDLDGSDGDDFGYAPQPGMDEQPRREQHTQGQNIQGQGGQQASGTPQGQVSEGREQPPRENRREPRRERRPDRPERVVQQPNQQPAEISAPVADPDGPQPVIEGTPAEVAVEEEAQAEAAPRRRRNAGNRPRRPRRGEAGAEEGEASGDDQPALAEAAGE